MCCFREIVSNLCVVVPNTIGRHLEDGDMILELAQVHVALASERIEPETQLVDGLKGPPQVTVPSGICWRYLFIIPTLYGLAERAMLEAILKVHTALGAAPCIWPVTVLVLYSVH